MRVYTTLAYNLKTNATFYSAIKLLVILCLNTLVFINNQKEYLDFLTNHLERIENDSVLWFAYPKGTSKIKTDINRDTIRTTGVEFGITTVTAVSINETWSALRFRPIDKVGKR